MAQVGSNVLLSLFSEYQERIFVSTCVIKQKLKQKIPTLFLAEKHHKHSIERDQLYYRISYQLCRLSAKRSFH